MTILNSIQEIIRKGEVSSLKKRTLYLAYLLLHIENPGLHPDDYLNVQGGYSGYMPILVNEVWNSNAGSLPDGFRYPCAFLKLEHTLRELDYLHDDLVADAADEAEELAANDLLACLNTFSMWVEEMKPSELPEAVDCLQKLYLYHACENDTAEEEAEKPAGVLRECADILDWIMHL